MFIGALDNATKRPSPKKDCVIDSMRERFERILSLRHVGEPARSRDQGDVAHVSVAVWKPLNSLAHNPHEDTDILPELPVTYSRQ